MGVEFVCLVSGVCLSVSRVNKFLSRVVARIEPTPKGHGRIAWALIKFEHGSIREFQSVIWDRHDCCQDLGFISIPNLDDVAVGKGVSQFENVRSSWQYLPGDFHRVAERHDGFFVPTVSSDARAKC